MGKAPLDQLSLKVPTKKIICICTEANCIPHLMVFNFQKFEGLEITATATRDNFKLKTLRWTNSTIFLQDILLISKFLHISYILGK